MSTGTLEIFSKAVAYSDVNPLSTPKKKFFDWFVNSPVIPCQNPSSVSYISPAGASQVVWNNQVSTAIDGTTAFTVTLNLALTNTYRFTNTAGTNPVFRTNRNITF